MSTHHLLFGAEIKVLSKSCVGSFSVAAATGLIAVAPLWHSYFLDNILNYFATFLPASWATFLIVQVQDLYIVGIIINNATLPS